MYVGSPSAARVTATGEHFLARDGDARLLLTADIFGATFHRAGDSPAVTGSGAFSLVLRLWGLPTGVLLSATLIDTVAVLLVVPPSEALNVNESGPW